MRDMRRACRSSRGLPSHSTPGGSSAWSDETGRASQPCSSAWRGSRKKSSGMSGSKARWSLPREGPSMCFWSCRTPTTSSFARACVTSWHPRPRLLPTSTNFVSKRSWRSLAWEMSPTAIPHRSREGRSRGASAPSRRSRARRRFSSTSPRAVLISGIWSALRSSCVKRRLAGRRWRSSATTRSSCQRPATRLCSSS